MKKFYYQYIYFTDKKKHRHYVGCMCAVKFVIAQKFFPQQILFGISQCNIKEDKFNKNVGRELAERRAINYFTPYKCKESKFYDFKGYDNYVSFKSNLERFIKRIMKQHPNAVITLPRNIIWK